MPMFDKAPILHPTPPDTFPPIAAPQGSIDPVATALVGVAVGAIGGATYMAAKRFSPRPDDESVPRGDAAPPSAEGGTP
jgi:hypothetical protein